MISPFSRVKLRCDSRFQRAFTACSCVFKVITLIGSNQGNYFENATTCSRRMRKTLVAMQLKYGNSGRTWSSFVNSLSITVEDFACGRSCLLQTIKIGILDRWTSGSVRIRNKNSAASTAVFCQKITFEKISIAINNEDSHTAKTF